MLPSTHVCRCIRTLTYHGKVVIEERWRYTMRSAPSDSHNSECRSLRASGGRPTSHSRVV